MTSAVRPAASLIVLRDRPAGPPELLIVQRGESLVFAGGAFVFPGGRVDEEDAALAARLCPQLEAEDGAARFAAIRETIEETGVAIALDPQPSDAQIAAWRRDGVALGGAFRVEIDRLTPFARWLPPQAAPRRFDTRFYLARAEGDAVPTDLTTDGVETEHAFWATAADVLARCDRKEGKALFPTRRLLERVARFASFAEAKAEAAALPERIISPWIEQRGDGDWLCIPEDAGYPVTAELLANATRFATPGDGQGAG